MSASVTVTAAGPLLTVMTARAMTVTDTFIFAEDEPATSGVAARLMTNESETRRTEVQGRFALRAISLLTAGGAPGALRAVNVVTTLCPCARASHTRIGVNTIL